MRGTVKPPDRSQAHDEHRAMFTALCARDLPRLEGLIRDHNRRAAEHYRSPA
jgi:DNA-binding GntR family transcriptional regulator